MKKLLAITLSLVLSLGLLTGCGSKEQSATLVSTTEESGLSMVDSITVDAEGSYSMTLTVDTSGDAVSQLSDLGLLQIQGDSEGTLSFDETVEALQAGGYTLAE